MFVFVIIDFPPAEKISERFGLPIRKLHSEKSQPIGILVKAAREMSQGLREWLGKYVTSGTVEIKNIERGLILQGHASEYRVIQPLDKGAMATIFEAEEVKTGKRMVLKSLSGLQEKIVVRRFIREARILASLGHPNIVSVYDLSKGIKMPFIVMEPLTTSAENKKSPNFKDLIKQYHKSEIDLRTMLYYVSDVSKALNYLHTHPEGPIIHRDLKPSNILFSKEKACSEGPERVTVKLVDFGLSRITGGSLTDLTRLQQIIGTPEYIPLQDMYNEEHENRTEARLDVYSLGVITYFIITGELPFKPKGNSLKQIDGNSPIGSPNGHRSDTPVNSMTRTDASREGSPEIIDEKSDFQVESNGENTVDYNPDLGENLIAEGNGESTIDYNPVSSGNQIMALLKMHTEVDPDFSKVRKDIPSSLIGLTRRMLAKHPEDRPHADEVDKEMRRIADLGIYLPVDMMNV